MKAEKRHKLEAAGWRVGDARDLLGLTAGEAEFIDIKLALASRLRELREERNWTQAELARQVGSSQSRVAKMESADSTVFNSGSGMLSRKFFGSEAGRAEAKWRSEPPCRLPVHVA